MNDTKILDVNGTTLDEWLELVRKPPTGKIFVRNMFSTEAHRNAWLKTAHLRPEKDVKLLLRHFLVSTGSNPSDQFNARILISQLPKDTSLDELMEHDRRLLYHVKSHGKYPVWEGLGWVIDLLPHHPRMALNVIDAFFYSYFGCLTDNYLSGLFDAEAIIRNRYIESFHTTDSATRVLQGLNWRELEFLCGSLYKHMGFKVIVTSRSNDDGADVFAENNICGQKELIVIQAKKWRESNPVGKAEVRELLGTISYHKVTKGVLVTTGRFESGAVQMAEDDPRIELLDQKQFLVLLNEHCGTDWFTRVDRLITLIKLGGSTPQIAT